MHAHPCRSGAFGRWDNAREPLDSFVPLVFGSVNLVQLNLPPLLRRECCSCFVPGSYTTSHSSHFTALPFCAVTILSSLVAILHFLSLFFFNRTLWLLLCPVCSFMSLFLPPAPHFLALRRSVHLIYIFICDWNHFAPVVFGGAVRGAGDKEVQLRRQKQPGGRNWNHQLLHMSPGWGLKPQRGGLLFFSKQRDMVHSCSLFRVVALQSVGHRV